MTIIIFPLIIVFLIIIAIAQHFMCLKLKKEITKFMPSIFFGVISILTLIITVLSKDWGTIIYFIGHLASIGMLISTCIGWSIYIFSKNTENSAHKKTKTIAEILFVFTGLLVIISTILVSIAFA